MNTDIVYRYLHERGPRSPYVPGIPARDIAEHELFENPDWQEIIDGNIASTGPIYAKVEPMKAKTKTVSKAEPVEDAKEPDKSTD